MNRADIINLAISHAMKAFDRFRSKERSYTAIGKLSDLFVPTGKDKPSNRGPVSMSEARKRLRYGFKPPGTMIIGVKDTNSMEPHIDDNCYVALDFLPDDAEVHVGSVYGYEHPTYGIILHRCITARSGGRYVFQGDNLKLPDPTVERSQIKYWLSGISYGEQDEPDD